MENIKQIKINKELHDIEDAQARKDIAAEVINRTNADKALDEKINTNKTGIDNLVNDVSMRNVKAEEVTNVPEVKLPLDEVKEEIEAAGNRVLNSIPDDYTQMNNKISELKGDIVDLDNAIYQKTDNMLEKISLISYADNVGIDVSVNDENEITIKGTATDNCQIDLKVICDDFTDGTYYFSDIKQLPSRGWYIWLCADINNPNDRLMYTTGSNGGNVFNVTSNKKATYLRIYIYSGTVIDCESIKFWINKDSKKEFEPYKLSKVIYDNECKKYTDERRYQTLKMNCLGDSITFGMVPDGSTTDQMERPFPSIIKERLNLAECRNYGVNGTCLSVVKEGDTGISNRANAFVTRFDSMDVDSNINCIFGGVNDYIRNLAGYYNKLGTIDDDVDTTIYGALNILANKLITVYPKAFNFFITPLRQAQVSGVTQKPNNPDYQFTLEDVTNAIKEVAYKYSIPVLDLYSYGGFHIENDTFRSIYGGNDKLHPNQLFVEEHLAPMIEQFIRSHI